MNNLTTESTEKLLDRISSLQTVQAANPPKSKQWQNASASLAPLFAEMARRQQAGLLS